MKIFYIGFFAGLLFSILFLNSLFPHLNQPFTPDHTDSYLMEFIFNHHFNVFSSGNWNQFSSLPMFFGFQNQLFFSETHFLQAIVAYPLFLVTHNLITAFNLFILLTIFLSYLTAYLFFFYISKNVMAAILASLVFIFNPFTMGHFPDHLELFSLYLIPLIFLFLEKILKAPSNKNVFLFFVFLTCQLLTSLYYSVFLSVILPLYLIFRLRHGGFRYRRFLNKGFLAGGMILAFVAILLSLQYSQVFSAQSIGRPLQKTADTYSASLSDLFFTPPQNLIYGNLKTEAALRFPSLVRFGIPWEENLFWGITPTILLLLSIKIVPKSRYKKLWIASISLLLLSLLFSLGPFMRITQKVNVPGPYLLFYYLDPLFEFIRVPARFGIFIFFFLSMITALTTSVLLERWSPKKGLAVAMLLVMLTTLEYWNKPWQFLDIPEATRQFYSNLEKQPQIKVILQYPIGNSLFSGYAQTRQEDEDAHYLLWASILHSKRLFNGYSGYIPETYYQRANYLSINFPTTVKLKQLKTWGVDAIVLDKKEFSTIAEFNKTDLSLKDLGVKKTASTDNLALFDLTNWSVK